MLFVRLSLLVVFLLLIDSSSSPFSCVPASSVMVVGVNAQQEEQNKTTTTTTSSRSSATTTRPTAEVVLTPSPQEISPEETKKKIIAVSCLGGGSIIIAVVCFCIRKKRQEARDREIKEKNAQLEREIEEQELADKAKHSDLFLVVGQRAQDSITNRDALDQMADAPLPPSRSESAPLPNEADAAAASGDDDKERPLLARIPSVDCGMHHPSSGKNACASSHFVAASTTPSSAPSRLPSFQQPPPTAVHAYSADEENMNSSARADSLSISPAPARKGDGSGTVTSTEDEGAMSDASSLGNLICRQQTQQQQQPQQHLQLNNENAPGDFGRADSLAVAGPDDSRGTFDGEDVDSPLGVASDGSGRGKLSVDFFDSTDDEETLKRRRRWQEQLRQKELDEAQAAAGHRYQHQSDAPADFFDHNSVAAEAVDEGGNVLQVESGCFVRADSNN